MTRGWNLFFGIVTVITIVTMMIPNVFGLEGFTQWGGMYVDGWCSIYVSEAPLDQEPDAANIEIREDEINVWYTPMHSAKSCVAWAHSWCGQPSPEGWPIVAAYAYHRGSYLENDIDICSLPDRASFRWYKR